MTARAEISGRLLFNGFTAREYFWSSPGNAPRASPTAWRLPTGSATCTWAATTAWRSEARDTWKQPSEIPSAVRIVALLQEALKAKKNGVRATA